SSPGSRAGRCRLAASDRGRSGDRSWSRARHPIRSHARRRTVHPALSTEKAGLPAFNPHKGTLTSFGAHATSRTRHESPLGTVEHDSITRTTSSTLPIFAFSTRNL